MSSAMKHKQRSHRSYRNQVSTAEYFQSRQLVKTASGNMIKQQSSFFTKLMGLFKKGDK